MWVHRMLCKMGVHAWVTFKEQSRHCRTCGKTTLRAKTVRGVLINLGPWS